MPLYEAQCLKCETVKEFYSPKYTEKNPKCKDCGSKTERVFSSMAFHDFNRIMGTTDLHPYVTRNITPDGTPLTITSHGQLERECRKYGVIHVPDRHNNIG